MRIVEERQTFVHTHFVTDGEHLSDDDARRIVRDVTAILREQRLVAGVRLAPPAPDDAGIHVVIECRPLHSDLCAIRPRIVESLAPIPRRPPVTVASGPYR